jgi:hypothetical protein
MATDSPPVDLLRHQIASEPELSEFRLVIDPPRKTSSWTSPIALACQVIPFVTINNNISKQPLVIPLSQPGMGTTGRN